MSSMIFVMAAISALIDSSRTIVAGDEYMTSLSKCKIALEIINVYRVIENCTISA